MCCTCQILLSFQHVHNNIQTIHGADNFSTCVGGLGLPLRRPGCKAIVNVSIGFSLSPRPVAAVIAV